MNFEFFAFMLLVISTLTGLVTEAVKKLSGERGAATKPNTTAGFVALALAAGIGIAYVLYSGQLFTVRIILCIVALVFLSWLCAMLGYDKVIQTLAQLRTGGKKVSGHD